MSTPGAKHRCVQTAEVSSPCSHDLSLSLAWLLFSHAARGTSFRTLVSHSHASLRRQPARMHRLGQQTRKYAFSLPTYDCAAGLTSVLRAASIGCVSLIAWIRYASPASRQFLSDRQPLQPCGFRQAHASAQCASASCIVRFNRLTQSQNAAAHSSLAPPRGPVSNVAWTMALQLVVGDRLAHAIDADVRELSASRETVRAQYAYRALRQTHTIAEPRHSRAWERVLYMSISVRFS